MSGVSKASRQQQRDVHWRILAIAVHHQDRVYIDALGGRAQADDNGPLVAEVRSKTDNLYRENAGSLGQFDGVGIECRTRAVINRVTRKAKSEPVPDWISRRRACERHPVVMLLDVRWLAAILGVMNLRKSEAAER